MRSIAPCGDLDAKRLGVRAYEMAGLHRIAPATTAYTISVGTPRRWPKPRRGRPTGRS